MVQFSKLHVEFYFPSCSTGHFLQLLFRHSGMSKLKCKKKIEAIPNEHVVPVFLIYEQKSNIVDFQKLNTLITKESLIGNEFVEDIRGIEKT